MKISLEKIIDNNGKNSFIVELLKEKSLTIVGYPAIRIELSQSQYKNTLIDIDVKDDYNNTYKIYKLKSETISSLPLYSKIKNNKIEYIGKDEVFNINTSNCIYSKLNKSNLSKDIIDIILEKITKAQYQNFTFATTDENITLIVPNILIGGFFYFPNTYIKRAFISQDINKNIHRSLSSCSKNNICLKSGVKSDNTTITLTYLYLCNKEANNSFNRAYYYNFRNRIKEATNEEKKQGYIYINPTFKFPINNKMQIALRGEYLDNNSFLVYEIKDINFRDLLNTQSINFFYENREITQTNYLKEFPLGTTKNKNISHNTKGNPTTKHNDLIVFTRDNTDIKIPQIDINKAENISRGEYQYSKPYDKEDNSLKGYSIGDLEDIDSDYAKATYSNLSFNFEKAINILINKLNLNSSDYDFYSNSQYYALKINYSNRQYFILELKKYNSSTLLFSSPNPFNCNNIAKSVLKLKENISTDNYKKLGYRLYKNSNICLHTPQKHTGNDIDTWVDRLIEKMGNYSKCKGV